MFNWAKQQLANVAGTQEPVYGPSAIRSVARESGASAYTELGRDDMKWKVMDSTNVESQTFYLMADTGRLAWVQVIYSNIAGISVTARFNVKVFSNDSSEPHLWCSTPLSNIDFSADKTAFHATDCSVELSEDGSSYVIKSLNDPRGTVDLKVTRTSAAFQAGKTGTTLFGTDLENPWGIMRHAFWPRAVAEGTITTGEGALDFSGRALYSYAIQGMKPHHAAARWKFIDFQGPNYSAIMMEFTTPVSYGSTVVNVGGIAKDGEIVYAGCDNEATHTAVKDDIETGWPEPVAVRFGWRGETKGGEDVEGVIEGSLGDCVDRTDVMAELPGFVKSLVASAAGTRPYIYQYISKATLNLKIGDKVIKEEGRVFSEASFIADT